MSLLAAGAGGFMIGLLVFFLLPFIGAGTGWGWPSRAMLFLATMPIRRFAIVVSENNDIVDKTMEYDALGFERITLDGVPKAFEDPANRLHSWLGLRFAFADEETGVLFDPRDAALGEQKRTFDERGEATFDATDGEYAEQGVEKWVPAAFTFDSGYQLVDLSAAAELVDGGERSEYPKRVKELYKHSRDPFGEAMSMLRLFLPVIAFMGTFGGIWMLASQIGVPGGSGGGGSVVGFGTLILLAGFPGFGGDDEGDDSADAGADGDPLADDPEDRGPPAEMNGAPDDGGDGPGFLDRHGATLAKIAGGIIGLALFAGFAVGLFALWGPIAAVLGVFAFGAGFLCLPVLAQLGRLSQGIGGAFTSLFFKLGFASYRKPVLVWTPKSYELREYDELPDVAPDPTWYTLFGSRIGFTFEPGKESFGEAGVSTGELDAHTTELATDGGANESNVPSVRYEKAAELGPDRMGGFVPSDKGAYGVLTDIALGWWSDSANGTKSMRELLQAKEEFGGDEPPVSDKTLAYLTAAMGIMGGILGIVIFVL